ncbi:MAG: anhydro-N-acetylmuramic acid kinase [Acidobacteria bacterium]|nr:anhydro-N-acetylmuramic acid kinase [Acidobacteriota bacterium]
MLVAGMMSGTSADAIDVAIVEIRGRAWNARVKLRAFQSFPYSDAVRTRILAIAGGEASSAGEISQLNFLLGELFARACLSTCRRSRIPIASVGLVGSHGQTIYHQSKSSNELGIKVRSTFQIGEPAIIAERTGVTTIADFRPSDMASGGQGAPLVPYFDYLIYRHKTRGRVALNLGGIANLTAIPPGAPSEDVFAFDTGPGNMLMDILASKATNGRLRYDHDGLMASRGKICERMIRELVRQKYFNRKPPKSTGREQFGADYLQEHFVRKIGGSGGSLMDALATVTAFTAETIAHAIGKFVLTQFPIRECFVSGGGVNNPFLMNQLGIRLQEATRKSGATMPIRIINTENSAIPSKAKEATAFAMLAYQTFHQEVSSLPSATGANHPAILGKIILGQKSRVDYQ